MELNVNKAKVLILLECLQAMEVEQMEGHELSNSDIGFSMGPDFYSLQNDLENLKIWV